MARILICIPKNRPQQYFEGEEIKGNVVISSSKVILTRSICVVLVGVESYEEMQTSTNLVAVSNGNGTSMVAVPTTEKKTERSSFLTMKKQLFGCRYNKRFQGDTLQLPAGSYTFPFSFKLPISGSKDNKGRVFRVPPSSTLTEGNGNVSVSYLVKAFLDVNTSSTIAMFGKQSQLTASWVVPVGGSTFDESYLVKGMKKGKSMKTNKGFMLEKGELSVKTSVSRTVLFSAPKPNAKSAETPGTSNSWPILEQPLQIKVEVENNSKQTVDGLKVSLLRRTTIPSVVATRESQYGLVQQQINVPAPQDGYSPVPVETTLDLSVPSGLVPTTHGKHFSIEWLLRVEVAVASNFRFNSVSFIPLDVVALGNECLLANISGLLGGTAPFLLPSFCSANKTCCVPSKQLTTPKTVEEQMNGKLKSTNSSLAEKKVIKWAKDDSTTKCTGCLKEFGVFMRRHHCRGCGLIFCSSCSPYSSLPQYGDSSERTCYGCSHLKGGIKKGVTSENDPNQNNIDPSTEKIIQSFTMLPSAISS